MLTQTDLENLARQMRDRGLHSSWIELIEFSRCVVGSLVDAYQALLKNSASSSSTLSNDPRALQLAVKNNIAKALTSLAGESQVVRWKSEALRG
jgi:hypothetical protein